MRPGVANACATAMADKYARAGTSTRRSKHLIDNFRIMIQPSLYDVRSLKLRR